MFGGIIEVLLALVKNRNGNLMKNNLFQTYLQNKLPLDRKKVLGLGYDIGYCSDQIAKLYPWMEVTNVDYSKHLITTVPFNSEQVSLKNADFAHLPLSNESFDCVYVNNTLEQTGDVEQILQEGHRVLSWGGVLVAAIPSNAFSDHELRILLDDLGFVNIEIQEIYTFCKLGMISYPPASDKMMYIVAWKRCQKISRLERAIEAMDWVYQTISPEKPNESGIPPDIIKSGYAWCGGYALVLQFVLEREGYKTRRVAFWMKPHPKGHGIEKVDSHALLEVYLDVKWQLLDPTCNIYFNGNSLDDLVRNPDLALPVFAEHEPDIRFRERRYDLYCTKWAFEKCYKTYYENPVFTNFKKSLKQYNKLYTIAKFMKHRILLYKV
ncbi:methyltransferase domain-containing protein [Coleofasciculus sp. F4-SAH-05]|uniref:methyltransferase domain-containing protein n=1 Tax=Coleofasciculus sp. F4-SAH-05 TaxID=3069525 RepID=UPI0032F4C530